MIPTAEQLGQARLAQWHQNGEALLTFENLRSWINVAGLVLFTPRPQQLPSPTPSFVEAVLGATNAEPTLADTEQARSLLTRLIAEGIAVPLNLLGTPAQNSGDVPDFIVSAPVFSYIFTLRGDKAWKQPPVTSGAFKVSPLAAATYEILTKRPMMTAYDLATELGKEVTETAVLRALNELWSHLRVLPIGQPDGGATLWELAGTRFTKQIKAGANAGQPSALSALISLYLGSALLASEEEIETFLSPLAARSRIRDVVHALMGARELESLAVDGRTLLHVSGSLPAFIAPKVEEDEAAKPVELLEVEGAATLEPTDAPRISKFVAKPRKIGTGFPSDYGRKFDGRPLDPRDDRDRRPFDRAAKPQRPARPSFDKPWNEERSARPAAGEASERPQEHSDRPARSYDRTPRFDRDRSSDRSSDRGFDRGSDRREGSRPAFGRKPGFGPRPGFGDKRSFGDKREGFSPRPSFRRDNDSRSEDSGRPPRREFTPRPDSDANGPRKTFSKPGTFGRKREGFGGKSAGGFAPRTPGSYSPRPGGDRGDRRDSGFAPRKPFAPREGGAGFSRDRDSQGERPSRPAFRKFDAPRSPRPSGDRPARPWNDRNDRGGDRPSRPYSARPSGGEGYARPDRGQDRGDRPARPYSKPAGAGFGTKKPFDKSGKPGGFAGKPVNTFTKFADGKNPFRKPGKPGGKANSFKGKATGGFDKPAYRKRKPEGGE
jgi:23S rRNA pseudouridine2605 synthase